MKSATRLCVFVLLIGALASCASYKSGVEVRKEGYDEIARSIKPGMHRRQLYALLPPMRTPQAEPPQGTYTFSIPGPLVFEQQEKHKLDEECFLIVRYQLKAAPPSADSITKELTPMRMGKKAALSPDDIDALLSEIVPAGLDTATSDARGAQLTPSRENPDDIIKQISRTFIERAPVPDNSPDTKIIPLIPPPANVVIEPTSRTTRPVPDTPFKTKRPAKP